MKKVLKNSIFIFMMFSFIAMIGCGKDAEVKKKELVKKVEVEKTLPKLIDLGAKNCIPCKKMAPILEELSGEYNGEFDVEFIDVWKAENQEKAKSYGIRSIPTQIFVDAKGKEIWRHIGFISKEDIMKKWNELGFIFKSVKKIESAIKGE